MILVSNCLMLYSIGLQPKGDGLHLASDSFFDHQRQSVFFLTSSKWQRVGVHHTHQTRARVHSRTLTRRKDRSVLRRRPREFFVEPKQGRKVTGRTGLTTKGTTPATRNRNKNDIEIHQNGHKKLLGLRTAQGSVRTQGNGASKESI